MSLVYVLVLGAALSLDALASGVAYGLKNIRIPLHSLLIVGAITCCFTALAIVFASALAMYVDAYTASAVGAVLLIALGLWSMFMEYMCHGAVENGGKPRKIKISVGRLVINIMANPEKADIDFSNSISSLEAVFLGVALGIDNMVATFAAALMQLLPVYTPVLMACIQMLFICVGYYAARWILPKKLKRHAPFLAGTILIVLGLMRLV